MIRLILAAMRHRRAQALTVLILTGFAAAAAVASPWYIYGAANTAATTDLASASSAQKMILVSRRISIGADGDALAVQNSARSAIEQRLTVPGSTAILGMQAVQSVRDGTDTVGLPFSYREDACTHLIITGACPTDKGQALLSTATAASLGLGIGDTLVLAPIGTEGATMTVVGTYRLTEPKSVYWIGSRYLGNAGSSASTAPLNNGVTIDPIFIPLESFGGIGLDGPTLTYDLHLPDNALRGAQGEALTRLAKTAGYQLSEDGYSLDFPGSSLADQLSVDQNTIRIGVPVGAIQLLALCWFALFLAARYTGRERRNDIALLKLRGATTWRLLRLSAGQSLVPMLAGTVLGAGVGYLTARALAGRIDPGDSRDALIFSGAAALLAVLGGLVAVVLAEWSTLRAPVADLLRGVPARRRGWRTDLVDLAVVTLALAAAYQAHAQGGDNGSAGLALLARGLIALAVALVLARVFGLALGVLGASALRTGRIRLALAALQITRRPGLDRVVALLMIAVAVLCTTAVDWSAASTARTERATVEQGATRVLTVQAHGRISLLGAVRAADPTGTKAMAVEYTAGGGGAPAVLAVDASRLAAVPIWEPGYGVPDPAALARLLQPKTPAPILVHGTGLALSTKASAPGAYVVATVQDLGSGDTHDAVLGPLPVGTATSTATITGCDSGAGCRLLSLRVTGAAAGKLGYLQPPGRLTVQVTDVRQQGPDAEVAGLSVLGDVSRWRAAFSGDSLTLSATGTGLLLNVTSTGNAVDQDAYVIDSATPLPTVTAGGTARLWSLSDPTMEPFGGAEVPISLVGAVPVLPVLGGNGVIVDLANAASLDAVPSARNQLQVWLAPDADAALVNRLKSNGLVILGDTSITSATTRYARQGPTAALRFALLTAIVGLLLGAAAIAVAATVETRPRAAELAALRSQGLPHRSARAVSYGGYAGLVLLALAGGLTAAVLARLLVSTGLPVFVDSWTVLPISTGLRMYPLGLALLGSLLVLGVTALVAAARLVTSTATNPATGEVNQ